MLESKTHLTGFQSAIQKGDVIEVPSHCHCGHKDYVRPGTSVAPHVCERSCLGMMPKDQCHVASRIPLKDLRGHLKECTHGACVILGHLLHTEIDKATDRADNEIEVLRHNYSDLRNHAIDLEKHAAHLEKHAADLEIKNAAMAHDLDFERKRQLNQNAAAAADTGDDTGDDMVIEGHGTSTDPICI
jgi:hypothetical protein